MNLLKWNNTARNIELSSLHLRDQCRFHSVIQMSLIHDLVDYKWLHQAIGFILFDGTGLYREWIWIRQCQYKTQLMVLIEIDTPLYTIMTSSWSIHTFSALFIHCSGIGMFLILLQNFHYFHFICFTNVFVVVVGC